MDTLTAEMPNKRSGFIKNGASFQLEPTGIIIKIIKISFKFLWLVGFKNKKKERQRFTQQFVI